MVKIRFQIVPDDIMSCVVIIVGDFINDFNLKISPGQALERKKSSDNANQLKECNFDNELMSTDIASEPEI